MKSFQEFTIVTTNPYCEVMVDIDIESGKIVGLYCYADSLPAIENEETGHDYKYSTKPGKNPLFVHIQRKESIFKKMVLNGFLFSSGSDDEQEETENQRIINLALNRYEIPSSLVPY